MNKKITRRKLAALVGKRLNNKIKLIHIENILSILAEEFITELKIKESISLKNFCSFKLVKLKPRKFWNLKKNRISISKGSNKFQIKLKKPLRNYIINRIDLVKTFLEDK